jgi:agmatinase
MPGERGRRPQTTAVLFFPFDLFGSGGAGKGAQLLADAFREMLDDNNRERKPTRAHAYARHVRMQEFQFENLAAYQNWRPLARQAIGKVFARKEFLYWVSGNHLGVLPVYEELSGQTQDALVIQFDAHLDIYHLSDCTKELSHGNFLLHAKNSLPAVINVGSRELLLTPDYVTRFYRRVFSAAELAVDTVPACAAIQAAGEAAETIFLDIDCDVLDPAFFPAVTHPTPFGLDPPTLLRLLDATWSDKVAGVAISEFDPARDVNDRCLATLMWLIEFLLLKQYEFSSAPRP